MTKPSAHDHPLVPPRREWDGASHPLRRERPFQVSAPKTAGDSPCPAHLLGVGSASILLLSTDGRTPVAPWHECTGRIRRLRTTERRRSAQPEPRRHRRNPAWGRRSAERAKGSRTTALLNTHTRARQDRSTRARAAITSHRVPPRNSRARREKETRPFTTSLADSQEARAVSTQRPRRRRLETGFPRHGPGRGGSANKVARAATQRRSSGHFSSFFSQSCDSFIDRTLEMALSRVLVLSLAVLVLGAAVSSARPEPADFDEDASTLDQLIEAVRTLSRGCNDGGLRRGSWLALLTTRQRQSASARAHASPAARGAREGDGG